MRLIKMLGFVILLVGCRSEESWRELTISSNVEVGLPAVAIFASLSTFEGLSAAVPDLFWIEKVEGQGQDLTRILILSDSTYFEEELVSADDQKLLLNYHVLRTSLPIRNTNHSIQVSESSNGKINQIIWTTELIVQEKHRNEIKNKFAGMQEAFLYSLQLLGVELEEIMQDESF